MAGRPGEFYGEPPHNLKHIKLLDPIEIYYIIYMKNLLFACAFLIVGFVQSQDCAASYVWTYIEWRGEQLYDCYTPVPNALCNNPDVSIYPSYWQCCSGSVEEPGFSLTPCQDQIGIEEYKVIDPGDKYYDLLGRGYDSYENIPKHVVYVYKGRLHVKLFNY